MTKLYHSEIGLPEGLLAPLLSQTRKLNYTRHAMNEVLADRYGAPRRMPTEYQVARAHVFEVEVTDGWVTKLCVRLCPHSDFIPAKPGLDLILVLAPDKHNSEAFFVKTLWFNESSDKHATLDRSKYATV